MDPDTLIGRLVQSSSTGFSFICTEDNIARPRLGHLLRAEIEPCLLMYSIIVEISWQSDEMVRQIARSTRAERSVFQDNQFNRGSGAVFEAIAIGYRDRDVDHQTLPPQPPYSLSEVHLCSPQEITSFTGSSLAYLRLILQVGDRYPMVDILAAHLQQVNECQSACGNPIWISRATQRLAQLLRDDYPIAINLFEAISQRIP